MTKVVAMSKLLAILVAVQLSAWSALRPAVGIEALRGGAYCGGTTQWTCAGFNCGGAQYDRCDAGYTMTCGGQYPNNCTAVGCFAGQFGAQVCN